jgi:hypothetical protein
MGTRGRHDRTRDFFRGAELDLVKSGFELRATYDAKVRLLESFSPKRSPTPSRTAATWRYPTPAILVSSKGRRSSTPRP